MPELFQSLVPTLHGVIFKKDEAGVTVDSWKVEDWAKAIIMLLNADQDEFDNFSRHAFTLAENYFHDNDFKSGYLNLFES